MFDLVGVGEELFDPVDVFRLKVVKVVPNKGDNYSAYQAYVVWSLSGLARFAMGATPTSRLAASNRDMYVLPLTVPSMLNSYSFLAYFCQNYTPTIIGIILFVMILQIRHDGDGTVSSGNPLLGITFNGEAAFRVIIRLVIIRLSCEKLFKHRYKTYGNGN